MSAPQTLKRAEYFEQLTAQLTDLQPVEPYAYGLRVQRFQIYVENDNALGMVTAVRVQTDHRRERRFTNIAPAHVAKQIRRLLAERDAAQAQREASRKAWQAQVARETTARARVEALMLETNRAAAAGGEGWLVLKAEVEEVSDAGGAVDYEFTLDLRHLREDETLAILKIVQHAAVQRQLRTAALVEASAARDGVEAK